MKKSAFLGNFLPIWVVYRI